MAIKFNVLKKNRDVIKAYHRLFNTVDGKIVLQDLMQKHNMLKPVFDENPYSMAHKEGERNVVLRLMQFLNVSGEALEEMTKEQTERDAQYYEEEDYA